MSCALRLGEVICNTQGVSDSRLYYHRVNLTRTGITGGEGPEGVCQARPGQWRGHLPAQPGRRRGRAVQLASSRAEWALKFSDALMLAGLPCRSANYVRARQHGSLVLCMLCNPFSLSQSRSVSWRGHEPAAPPAWWWWPGPRATMTGMNECLGWARAAAGR